MSGLPGVRGSGDVGDVGAAGNPGISGLPGVRGCRGCRESGDVGLAGSGDVGLAGSGGCRSCRDAGLRRHPQASRLKRQEWSRAQRAGRGCARSTGIRLRTADLARTPHNLEGAGHPHPHAPQPGRCRTPPPARPTTWKVPDTPTRTPHNLEGSGRKCVLNLPGCGRRAWPLQDPGTLRTQECPQASRLIGTSRFPSRRWRVADNRSSATLQVDAPRRLFAATFRIDRERPCPPGRDSRPKANSGLRTPDLNAGRLVGWSAGAAGRPGRLVGRGGWSAGAGGRPGQRRAVRPVGTAAGRIIPR
jgi:hypothetical protein